MIKFIDPGVKRIVFWAREMAYQLRSWTILAEDPSWIPSTHTSGSQTTVPGTPRDLTPLASTDICIHVCLPTHRHTHN